MKYILLLTASLALYSCGGYSSRSDEVEILASSYEAKKLDQKFRDGSLFNDENKTVIDENEPLKEIELSDIKEILKEDEQEAQLTQAKEAPKSLVKKEKEKSRSPASIPSSPPIPIGKKYDLKKLSRTSSFFYSVKNATPETLRFMVKKGANINATDEHGRTPLITAIINKRYDNAKFLIKKGADKSPLDNYGRKAYDYATKSGNKRILALFE